MTTIRALLVSGRKLELELHHTRLGPPVRYEDSTPTATSYTSVILALPTATRRVAPRPPPSRCASPRPRQCQSVTPPPSPPVVPAPSVRAGFPGNSLTTRRTPRQRKDDRGAWPPGLTGSGSRLGCRARTLPATRRRADVVPRRPGRRRHSALPLPPPADGASAAACATSDGGIDRPPLHRALHCRSPVRAADDRGGLSAEGWLTASPGAALDCHAGARRFGRARRLPAGRQFPPGAAALHPAWHGAASERRQTGRDGT